MQTQVAYSSFKAVTLHRHPYHPSTSFSILPKSGGNIETSQANRPYICEGTGTNVIIRASLYLLSNPRFKQAHYTSKLRASFCSPHCSPASKHHRTTPLCQKRKPAHHPHFDRGQLRPAILFSKPGPHTAKTHQFQLLLMFEVQNLPGFFFPFLSTHTSARPSLKYSCSPHQHRTNARARLLYDCSC